MQNCPINCKFYVCYHLKIRSHFHFQQIIELSHREGQSITRNTAALIARFGITIFLNLLFGCIFLNAGQGDNSNTAQFQAHYGSITFVMIFAMFGSAQPVMLAFPFERPMFLREYSTGTCTFLLTL